MEACNTAVVSQRRHVTIKAHITGGVQSWMGQVMYVRYGDATAEFAFARMNACLSLSCTVSTRVVFSVTPAESASLAHVADFFVQGHGSHSCLSNSMLWFDL